MKLDNIAIMIMLEVLTKFLRSFSYDNTGDMTIAADSHNIEIFTSLNYILIRTYVYILNL